MLFNGVQFETLVALLLFIGVLMLINEVTRRSKYLSVGVYVIMPVVLAILIYKGVLGSPTGNTWFGWVKVVSALIGVYGFLLIRFTRLKDTRFAALFPVMILSINIAEAIYREFEVFMTYKTLTVDAGGILIQGGIWNLFNCVAGIICIITLTGFSGIKVSKDKSQDMIWPDMTWMYIIGYTLWNFAYVYNCISTRSMYAGFGILLAALLAEFLFKKGAWLQHRAQILSVYAMFSLSFDFQSNAYFNILPTYNPSALLTISLVAFGFNILFFAYMVLTIKKHKKNPLKDDVFSHTTYYKKSLLANKI